MSHSERERSALKVLCVAEGSGGHLVPALEVASRLAASGAFVKLWYAQRSQTQALVEALTRGHHTAAVDARAMPGHATAHPLLRLWQLGRLWRHSAREMAQWQPDVVVGFGGWSSIPVLLEARRRRVHCLLHEQNIIMGRANRWLSRLVDRIAVSWEQTQTPGHPAAVRVTGLPVRPAIGKVWRSAAAERFGLQPDRLTLLVLGGSQGSRAITLRALDAISRLPDAERARLQVIHLTGAMEADRVRHTYTAQRITAWVAPYLSEMEYAYALADVVIGRAGASTMAELARCGLPAILIPYPYAGGHQLANARRAASSGAATLLEEAHATPERLVGAIGRLLADVALRTRMGCAMRTLDAPDATAQMCQAIQELDGRPATSWTTPCVAPALSSA